MANIEVVYDELGFATRILTLAFDISEPDLRALIESKGFELQSNSGGPWPLAAKASSSEPVRYERADPDHPAFVHRLVLTPGQSRVTYDFHFDK
ncbi:hypothetical protein ACFL59_03740 [Planctomycetota bacterium]